MPPPLASDGLWLGAFVGAQVLVVFFCVIKANTYRERALLLHAAATLLGVLAAATVATRILVAGLREPLPGIATEFLRLRLVMAAVPQEEVAPRLLVNRLGARLDQELQAQSERRIVTVGYEELISRLADLTA